MKKIKAETWVFSALIAVIAFVTSYAVICPKIYLSPALQASFETTADGRLVYGIKRYIAVVAIAVIVFLAYFFIDLFAKLSTKICESLRKNYKTLIKHIIALSSAVALGFITELLYRLIRGTDSIGSYFNNATAAAFCALYVLIAIIVTERKNFAKAPEKAVALMILTLGVLVIVAQPFSHNCWDIDSHYPWAVHNSFYKTAFYTAADNGVDNVGTLMFITNGTDVAAKTLAQSEVFKANMNSVADVMIIAKPVEFSIAHVPAGVGIALARLFGAGFQLRYYCGELANVVLYSTICYFAIKKLKSGKMLMSIIALFPTNIYLAANYSYDWWVTGFMLLGTAYFFSELEQPDKKITVWETVIMCTAFMLASLPKLVYVIMFALPLFMIKRNRTKREKITYYAIWAAFFLITVILFAVKSLGAVGGSGDSRGGAVNPSEQMAFIFGSPREYARILIDFLKGYISIEGMKGYICNFAYLGTARTASVFIILLLFAAITDKENDNKIKGLWIPRTVSIALFLGGAALIATALYIDFTPVRSASVAGCQPRYLTPLIAPVLLMAANPCTTIKNKGKYNLAMFCAISIATWASLGEAIVKIMR